jgi:hypothetical protein
VQFEFSNSLIVEHLNVIEDKNLLVSTDIKSLLYLCLEIPDSEILVELKPKFTLDFDSIDDDGVCLVDDHLEVVTVLDVMKVIRDALRILQLFFVENEDELMSAYLRSLLDLHLEQVHGVRFDDIDGKFSAGLGIQDLYLHVV